MPRQVVEVTNTWTQLSDKRAVFTVVDTPARCAILLNDVDDNDDTATSDVAERGDQWVQNENKLTFMRARDEACSLKVIVDEEGS